MQESPVSLGEPSPEQEKMFASAMGGIPPKRELKEISMRKRAKPATAEVKVQPGEATPTGKLVSAEPKKSLAERADEFARKREANEATHKDAIARLDRLIEEHAATKDVPGADKVAMQAEFHRRSAVRAAAEKMKQRLVQGSTPEEAMAAAEIAGKKTYQRRAGNDTFSGIHEVKEAFSPTPAPVPFSHEDPAIHKLSQRKAKSGPDVQRFLDMLGYKGTTIDRPTGGRGVGVTNVEIRHGGKGMSVSDVKDRTLGEWAQEAEKVFGKVPLAKPLDVPAGQVSIKLPKSEADHLADLYGERAIDLRNDGEHREASIAEKLAESFGKNRNGLVHFDKEHASDVVDEIDNYLDISHGNLHHYKKMMAKGEESEPISGFTHKELISQHKKDLNEYLSALDSISDPEVRQMAHERSRQAVFDKSKGKFRMATRSDDPYEMPGPLGAKRGEKPKAAVQTSVKERILRGMQEIETGADSGALVSTKSLREHLKDIPKEQFDSAVEELAREQRISPHAHDYPASRTPEELEKMVKSGDNYWVGVAKKPEGKR